MFSYPYNPRRLEDAGYPLWTLHLTESIEDLRDVFLVAPQYRIFKCSKLLPRPADGDSSMTTVTDSKARGVIVDNCLLMAELHPTQISGFSTIKDLFAKLRRRIPKPVYSIA